MREYCAVIGPALHMQCKATNCCKRSYHADPLAERGVATQDQQRWRFRRIDHFERSSLLSVMPYSKQWKVIPQFVPLNDLHENICTFRVGAVQEERLRIFVQLKFVREKIKMGVTYAHIELATGKW